MLERPKILIVDDELGPRESLKMILRDDYDIITAANGKEAIAHLGNTEYDLAILDIRMPDINGTDLLQIVKEKAPATEVIMITAYASVDTATKALRAGALDYLIKPFELSTVRDIVGKGIARRNEMGLVRKRIQDLQLANKTLENEVENTYNNINSHYQETITSLVIAIDAKDSYTKGHQERVARLVLMISEQMKIPDHNLITFQQAATLHDIGKIGVAEDILRKDGDLNNSEYDIIKKHPVIGAEILSPVQMLKEVVPLVLHHHERYDGSGYPDGISGESIPLGARIIAVADAIDAMLWERPYSAAKSTDEVRNELKRVAGTQLDPDIVEAALDQELVIGFDYAH
jgi:putative two-component system response regulator